MEIRVFHLVLGDRRREARVGAGSVVERICAKDTPELRSIGRSPQSRDYVSGRRVRHFARVDERLLSLLRERRRPAIAEQAAECRSFFVIAEWRREARVADRGRIADSGLVFARAALRHEIAGRCGMGEFRPVTGLAGKSPGNRQRFVAEQLLAQRGNRREAGRWRFSLPATGAGLPPQDASKAAPTIKGVNFKVFTRKAG